MKATIKRPDGTIISLDNATAEDVEKLAGTPHAPHTCAPCMLPHFPSSVQPLPQYVIGDPPWGTTCMDALFPAPIGSPNTACMQPLSDSFFARNPAFFTYTASPA